jgi:hypothetical protein
MAVATRRAGRTYSSSACPMYHCSPGKEKRSVQDMIKECRAKAFILLVMAPSPSISSVTISSSADRLLRDQEWRDRRYAARCGLPVQYPGVLEFLQCHLLMKDDYRLGGSFNDGKGQAISKQRRITWQRHYPLQRRECDQYGPKRSGPRFWFRVFVHQRQQNTIRNTRNRN